MKRKGAWFFGNMIAGSSEARMRVRVEAKLAKTGHVRASDRGGVGKNARNPGFLPPIRAVDRKIGKGAP